MTFDAESSEYFLIINDSNHSEMIQGQPSVEKPSDWKDDSYFPAPKQELSAGSWTIIRIYDDLEIHLTSEVPTTVTLEPTVTQKSNNKAMAIGITIVIYVLVSCIYLLIILNS